MQDSTTIEQTIYLPVNDTEIEAHAEFKFTWDEYPAEPTSWGAARGTEYEPICAILLCVKLGKLWLTRAQVELMVGADELTAIEDHIAETGIDYVGY